MWAAIASAAASIAGSAINAFKNAKTRKLQRENLARDWEEYESTANRLRNRSLKSDEGYQYAMSRTGEELQKQNDKADAMQATGAISQEQSAAIKENNNKALVNAEQPFVNREEQIREYNENLLNNQKQQLQTRQDAINNGEVASRNQSTAQLVNTLGKVGSAVDEAFSSNTNSNTDGTTRGTSATGTQTDTANTSAVGVTAPNPATRAISETGNALGYQAGKQTITGQNVESIADRAGSMMPQMPASKINMASAVKRTSANQSKSATGYYPGQTLAGKDVRNTYIKNGIQPMPRLGVDMSSFKYNYYPDGTIHSWAKE